MKLNEKQLIQKSKNGDTLAFEQLMKKHEVKIYNLILSMIGNKTEAADLFQDTFLNAWHKLKNFRGDSDFSTWLYRIAINEVLMKKRKNKRANMVSIDSPIQTNKGEIEREFAEDWSKNPVASLENDELKNRLSGAIQALPPMYRSVLILRDVQGLSNNEVKKILKISLPSVKSRLHRARLFVRNNLSGYFGRA